MKGKTVRERGRARERESVREREGQRGTERERETKTDFRERKRKRRKKERRRARERAKGASKGREGRVWWFHYRRHWRRIFVLKRENMREEADGKLRSEERERTKKEKRATCGLVIVAEIPTPPPQATI